MKLKPGRYVLCSARHTMCTMFRNTETDNWLHTLSVLNAPEPCPCVNLLKPNDSYSGRTAPLTSKCCILYIYSTNIGTEYFKHGIYCLFFPLPNAVCFINLTYLVPVLFIF